MKKVPQRPTDRRSPSWPPAWADLVDAYDGPHAFAELVGCHYQTLWRWALRGARVPKPAARLIDVLAIRAKRRSPIRKKQTYVST